jgi:hypothetical protein
MYGGTALHHILSGVAIVKGRNLKAAIDLLLLASPTFRVSKDPSTGHLVFPLDILSTESLERIRHRIEEDIMKDSGISLGSAEISDKKLRLYNQRMDQMVLSEISSENIHIHCPSDLLVILRRAEKDIEALREARMRLAEFIKDSFSLESILA